MKSNHAEIRLLASIEKEIDGLLSYYAALPKVKLEIHAYACKADFEEKADDDIDLPKTFKNYEKMIITEIKKFIAGRKADIIFDWIPTRGRRGIFVENKKELNDNGWTDSQIGNLEQKGLAFTNKIIGAGEYWAYKN